MSKDIPDYMRGFDLNDESWGVGPAVAEVPKSEPGIDPKKIDSQSLVYDAFKIMKSHNIMQLIVLENGSYKGIIHLHDIIKEGIV